MKHSHDPAFLRGTRQAPTLLEGFTMLASHQEMDVHPLLLFAGTWGGVGIANREGGVGESQLRKLDSTYAVNSTACIIPI